MWWEAVFPLLCIGHWIPNPGLRLRLWQIGIGHAFLQTCKKAQESASILKSIQRSVFNHVSNQFVTVVRQIFVDAFAMNVWFNHLLLKHMERMEEEFSRAGLHRYMYLDPGVLPPESSRDPWAKWYCSWSCWKTDWYCRTDLNIHDQNTQLVLYVPRKIWSFLVLVLTSENHKSFGSLCGSLPWVWQRCQKIACLNRFFLTTKCIGKFSVWKAWV